MKLTNSNVKAVKPCADGKDLFVRCSYTTGFGVKVLPSGRKSFFAEARIKGTSRSARKSVGTFPTLSVEDARSAALSVLRSYQLGEDPAEAEKEEREKQEFQTKSLWSVYEDYVDGRALKPKTVQGYRSLMNTVFKDWSSKPITSITRKRVSQRFTAELEERGERTANLAFTLLSALMNWAMAEEYNGSRLITDNPVNVLKERKLKKSSRRRERYLSEEEIDRIFQFCRMKFDHPEAAGHGVSRQGRNFILLLLFTGLRRGEAMNLLWENVSLEKDFMLVKNTKNGTDHTIPLSLDVKIYIEDQFQLSGELPWVFPNRFKTGPMTEPKSQLRAFCKATGVQFKLHDLRRTFATHAARAGVDIDQISKALNHQSGGSITSSYIISSAESLRPVFDKIFEVYHRIYDDWEYFEMTEPNTPHKLNENTEVES